MHCTYLQTLELRYKNFFSTFSKANNTEIFSNCFYFFYCCNSNFKLFFSLELFADVVPKTAENFRQFCTGEYRKDGVPLGYKGASFHRIIKDFMVQCGDFVNGDGTGCMSIYAGTTFADENFSIKHTEPGLLSMANSRKDTNGCQFFITAAKCDFLDGKHVVFGRVIDGMLVVRKIENAPVGPNNKPKVDIIVSQCGQM